MTSELYLAFVAATVVLILIPGPNVALIVANSVSHGTASGLVTVAGTSSAMVIQLALTVAGLSGLLATLGAGFEVLRWLGVAYLLYLGFKAWRAPAVDLSAVEAEPRVWKRMFLRGFLISLTNPKTLLFYAAFLPQFVVSSATAAPQLLLLATTFLSLAVVLDGAWAVLAGRVRGVLAVRGRALNRLTGGLLISAAAGLALARRS